MEDFIKHKARAFKRINLTHAEKTRMRNSLTHFMLENPVRSSFSSRFMSLFATSPVATRYIYVERTAMAFALVVVVGLSTSYAADNSLPGDALYAVKTQVNERVQGSFALTDTSKIAWSTHQAEVRLQEAESLAAQGRLTPVTSEALLSGFEVAAQNFDTQLSTLSEQQDDDRVLTAQSDFEASLNVHQGVLSALSLSSTSIDTSMQPLIVRVRSRAKDVSENRQKSEESLAIKDDSNIRSAAIRQKKNAEKHVKSIRGINQIPTVMSATTTATVDASTQLAEKDISNGDNEIKRGKWGKAIGSFQSAIRTVQETQATLDAGERLGDEILNNIQMSHSGKNKDSSDDSNDESSKSGKDD